MTEHRITVTEVWLCTCGRYFLDDKEARSHIFEPVYDPDQSQWRPIPEWGGMDPTSYVTPPGVDLRIPAEDDS
jgi:hypothetical protein